MDEESIAWIPPIDFYDSGGEYVLCAEIPGVDLEDIQIEFSGNRFTVHGERRFDTCCAEENYQRLEGQRGRFLRTFLLPESVQRDEVRMKLENGIFHMVLPKAVQSARKSPRSRR